MCARLCACVSRAYMRKHALAAPDERSAMNSHKKISVGIDGSENSLRALRWGGRFVSVGFASGEIPQSPLNLVLLKGVNVTGFTMEGFSRNQADDELRDRTELGHLLSVGAVSPHVSSVYSLAQAAQALGELADRTALGKVLIDPRLA